MKIPEAYIAKADGSGICLFLDGIRIDPNKNVRSWKPGEPEQKDTYSRLPRLLFTR